MASFHRFRIQAGRKSVLGNLDKVIQPSHLATGKLEVAPLGAFFHYTFWGMETAIRLKYNAFFDHYYCTMESNNR